MRQVNVARVRDLLGNISEALHALRQLASLSEAEFLGDFRNTESAKYLLIKATEAAIDVCTHIVARAEGRAPQDYADCFTVLRSLGIIGEPLSERLRKMARFRNLLVHVYWQVDNAQVFRVIGNELDDLVKFQEQVGQWLVSQRSAET